jgi:hypothetical protein
MDLAAAASAEAAENATPLANAQDSPAEYIGETEKNVTSEQVETPAEEVEAPPVIAEEAVAMAAEETPSSNSEEEESPVVSEETKEVPTEADEDDMSW